MSAIPQPRCAPPQPTDSLLTDECVLGLFHDLRDHFGDEADAQDAVQEAMCRTLELRRDRQGELPRTPLPWLRAVTRHALIDAFRKSLVRKHEPLHSVKATVMPANDLEEGETRERVRQAVACLPDYL